MVGYNKAKMPLVKGQSTLDIVDMTCVQCLIGRVPTGGGIEAIIDRTGDTQKAYLLED